VTTYTLHHWARLHTVSAVAVRDRWLKSPDKSLRDPLLDPSRFSEVGRVWTVASELELIRVIGAIQWLNPRLKLWYRGEKQFYPKASPSRSRLSSSDATVTKRSLDWLNLHAEKDRALRDRSPLARVALLQHYGCATSLLDVSASHEAACAFAFATDVAGQSHLRIFGLPRHDSPVTVFDDADVVLVDLHAELPSYCMRPHVQQAAFIARRIAAYQDIEGEAPVSLEDALVDDLCIAHLRLDFDGRSRFFDPRALSDAIYPQPSASCRNCTGTSDMTGDFLMHFLTCIAKKGGPEGFPDRLCEWAASQAVAARRRSSAPKA
jgi:hypothetical protein